MRKGPGRSTVIRSERTLRYSEGDRESTPVVGTLPSVGMTFTKTSFTVHLIVRFDEKFFKYYGVESRIGQVRYPGLHQQVNARIGYGYDSRFPHQDAVRLAI